jgi:hypothetical protein
MPSYGKVLINGIIGMWESGEKPHSDKQLTGLRPDRGGRNWLRVSLKNE